MIRFKKHSYGFFDILFFLNILLIGSDKLAFSVSGFNVRIVQLLLLFTSVLFIFTGKLRFKNALIFIPFLAANLFSTFGSYDLKSSIAYTIWTVFNYIFIFCLFYSWAKNESHEKVYSIWRTTFILQGIYVLAQFTVGLFGIKDRFFGTDVYKGIPRPAVWFYEPSYIATYFSIYFSIAIFMFVNKKTKAYRNDLILSTIFILFITSSTGYLGIAASVVLCVLFFNKAKLSKKVSFGLQISGVLAVFTGLLYVVYPKVLDVFVGRLFREGISGSSGGRVSGWNTAFEIFKEHWLLGIGPNSYQAYLNIDVPPTNVTLEILCNLGIIGFITFIIFVGGTLLKAWIKARSYEAEKAFMVKAMVFAFIIFWIVLQANQNYLRIYMWMHLGLLAGISAGCNSGPQRLEDGEKDVE